MTGLCNALNDRRALSRQTLRILSDATGEVYITTHPCSIRNVEWQCIDCNIDTSSTISTGLYMLNRRLYVCMDDILPCSVLLL